MRERSSTTENKNMLSENMVMSLVAVTRQRVDGWRRKWNEGRRREKIV